MKILPDRTEYFQILQFEFFENMDIIGMKLMNDVTADVYLKF